MVIDCDNCEMREIACDDCVVSVLLSIAPPQIGSGHPRRDGAAGDRADPSPLLSLEEDTAAALRVLGNAGLAPPLRLRLPPAAAG